MIRYQHNESNFINKRINITKKFSIKMLASTVHVWVWCMELLGDPVSSLNVQNQNTGSRCERSWLRPQHRALQAPSCPLSSCHPWGERRHPGFPGKRLSESLPSPPPAFTLPGCVASVTGLTGLSSLSFLGCKIKRLGGSFQEPSRPEVQ